MNRKLIAMAAAGVMLVSTVPAFTAFAQDSTPATEVVTDVETAGPEDVVVRTSIGSGQVIFHKTEEAADITAQDLKARVKDAVVKAEELETFDAFLDLEADVKIKLGEGEENQLGIVASAIGTAQEYAHKEHGTFFYSLDGLGVPMSGNYEGYHWEKDDVHYTAVSDGTKWSVKIENIMEEFFERLEMLADSEPVNLVSLDGLKPTLYEEDGTKYYVCVMDKSMLMNTAGSFSQAQSYLPTAEQILGDNDVTLTVVVNAETGLPRAISLDASGAAGQVPGQMLGAEGNLEFGADQLYATFLLNQDAQDFEIPEEVLNTPVENAYEVVEDVVSGLGGLLSGLSQ